MSEQSKVKAGEADVRPVARAEISVDGRGFLIVRLFNGQVLELDPRPYRFPSGERAEQFLVSILSRALHETMILANLRPTAVTPKADLPVNGGRQCR
jgi:hypothetical protein